MKDYKIGGILLALGLLPYAQATVLTASSLSLYDAGSSDLFS